MISRPIRPSLPSTESATRSDLVSSREKTYLPPPLSPTNGLLRCRLIIYLFVRFLGVFWRQLNLPHS